MQVRFAVCTAEVTVNNLISAHRMVHTIIRIKIIVTKKVRTKFGSTNRRALIFGEPFIYSFYIIFTISNTTKKMTDVMKEKPNPLIEEYRRINSKPNWF